MKKLAIFDLDGTLFDTTGAMAACGNYALARLGLPVFEQKAYGGFSGGGIEDFVCGILEAAGDREHRFYEEFWRLYLERQGSLTEEANVPYDGILPLLSALKEQGVRLAVLSNKDHASCIEIVERAFGKGVFDLILGDRPPRPPKPQPHGVFEILETLGFASEDCIYVGDTQIDMQTGKAAGLHTVAALWGYRTREQLAPFAPETEVSHPLELLSLFQEV